VWYFTLSGVDSLNDLEKKSVNMDPLAGGMENGRSHKRGFFCVDFLG
jgi:hypothetical protein